MSGYQTPQSVPGSHESPASRITNHAQSRKHPCVLCQQRKVKCDRSIPCANCNKARVDCISSTSIPPRKRKKRFSEAELLARLSRYEEHLRGYGADLKTINEGIVVPKRGPNQHIPDEDQKEDKPDFFALRRSLRKVENNLWDGVDQDFRDTEDLLQGSSDDEMFKTPITASYQERFGGGADFYLPSEPLGTLEDLHPQPVQIFQLWQIFLRSINPLIRIFHAPTVQSQILDAASDLSRVDKNMEALMFGVYSMSIYSLSEMECQEKFNKDRDDLLRQFQSGSRAALHRAGLLKSSELAILQAFVLYLMSCVNFSMDPRSIFSLCGAAIRMAQRMGLHSDGNNYGIPPFQVEMRRRLWWQLIIFDSRIAMISGAGPSVLTYQWTTKLPCNVNDSDLFQDMKTLPVDHVGSTEMGFVLQKCEILLQLHDVELAGSSAERRDKLVDTLEDTLRRKYTSYFDVSMPVQAMSVIVAKIAISSFRLGTRPRLLFTNLARNTPEENEISFRHALSMIEAHREMVTNLSLQHFRWHMWSHFPLPAYIYILIALRYLKNEELSGRAWIQIAEAYNTQDGPFSKATNHMSLYLAVGNLAIKAWEARESNQPNFNAHEALSTVPRFISVLRNNLLAKKQTSSKTSENNNSSRNMMNKEFVKLGEEWGNQIHVANMWEAGNSDFQGFDQMFSGIMTQDQSIGWGVSDNFMNLDYQEGGNSY